MSRIGKQPIVLPDKVKASIQNDQLLIEGPLGRLSLHLPKELSFETQGKEFLIKRNEDTPTARARHGLLRALIANMVQGVAQGFRRELDINGVGYRAELKGTDLNLSLGFSHPVIYKIPAGIKVAIEKQTKIILTGADRQLLGQVAAEIRNIKPPEPYKGKGVKYTDERIRRKAGKAAAGGAGAKGK